jgi:hypothetical protein
MRQATSGYGQMGDPRAQMMEGLMAAGAANPDFDRSGGGAEFVGRWPQNASGSRFVGGPPNTQRTDPGGAAFQGFMDPRNEYAGSGSRFQSPSYPHPDFFGIPPRPQLGPPPRQMNPSMMQRPYGR